MNTPTVRARHRSGALVGGCSALLTAAAHLAAGGALPGGAPLMLLLIVSATLGAATGRVRIAGPRATLALLVTALIAAQLLGHLVLALADHHHHGGLGLSAPMLTLHLAAALLLGGLIAVTEHLWLVCQSVLCWLRLFATTAPRPARRPRRYAVPTVLTVSVLLESGLGMRAPPRLASSI